MIVMVLERVPVSLRGELACWLLEVKPGIYVGHANAMVRDKLWEKCCQSKRAGGVFQAWNTNTEQKFTMRMAGMPSRSVEDWEGLLLIREETIGLRSKKRKRPRV